MERYRSRKKRFRGIRNFRVRFRSPYVAPPTFLHRNALRPVMFADNRSRFHRRPPFHRGTPEIIRFFNTSRYQQSAFEYFYFDKFLFFFQPLNNTPIIATSTTLITIKSINSILYDIDDSVY